MENILGDVFYTLKSEINVSNIIQQIRPEQTVFFENSTISWIGSLAFCNAG